MASQSNDQMTFRTKAEISLEYSALQNKNHCPLGMYVIPTVEAFNVWCGVLFVHQGYYANAIVKFRLTFPPDYPLRPPSVQFTTDIFHPLIAHPEGTFNLLPRFHPWLPNQHRIIHVLYWIKGCFKKQALDSLTENDCLNKEAYRLYHESISSFSALAAQSAMLSKSNSALFDRDHPRAGESNSAHDVLFHEMQETEKAELRRKLGLKLWK